MVFHNPRLRNCGMFCSSAYNLSYFLAIRQKLKEAVLSRYMNDVKFSYRFGDDYTKARVEGFYNLFDGLPQGWSACMTTSGSGEFCELQGIFDESAEHVIEILRTLADPDGTLYVSFNGEVPGSKEWRDIARQAVEDTFGDIKCSGLSDWESYEEDVNDAIDVLYSLHMIHEGNAEAALSINTMGMFVSDINSLYDDVYPEDYIVMHLDLFVGPLAFAHSDRMIETVSLQSKEIGQYLQYRHLVPEDVRQPIDEALRIFDNPFEAVEEEDDCLINLDAADFDGIHVVTLNLAQDSGESCVLGDEDRNVFYEEALQLLVEQLPVLRKMYLGDGESCHPDLFLYSIFRVSQRLWFLATDL